MPREICKWEGGTIEKPVFEMVVIINPDEKCCKNRAAKKDGLVNLTVIRFYEADDFLHVKTAK